MVTYDWNFGIIFQYREIFVTGLYVTVQLTVLSILFSVILGLIVSLFRMSRNPIILYPTVAYIEFLRAMPIMILLVWIYYCLPIILGIKMGGMASSIIALSLYSSAFYAEIFRAGIQSIEKGQIDAAQAVGMTPVLSFRRIVLPQAFRRTLPPFISQCILVFKNTTLCYALAVPEILYQGESLSMDTFRPLEILTIIAIVFVSIVIPITLVVNVLEKRSLIKT
jgi:polar amino acid transport system permease protein